MDVTPSLGEELDQDAENDFVAFIKLGGLLLELAGDTKGEIDLSQPVGPNGELPVLKGSGQLFDSVCLQLEVRCDFFPRSMWGGREQADVIAKWKALDTNTFLATSLKQVAALRARQGDKRSSDAHGKGANLIARSKIRITSGQQAQQIKGIGPKIAAKIDELLETHKLEILEHEQEVDRVIKLFTEIWGVNAATAHSWYERGFRTYEDVEEADIALTKLQKYWWRHKEDFPQPMERDEMKQIGALVEKAARSIDPDSETIIVGSYRRGKKFSKDVDILILVDHKERGLSGQIAEQLGTLCDFEVVVSGELVVMGGMRLPDSSSELQKGGQSATGKKSTVVQKMKKPVVQHLWRRIDFYVQLKEERACALLAHTGPYDYNIRLRGIAKEKSWKLNEYHLYDENGDIVPTESEADIQSLLEVDVLPPEGRL